MRERSSLLYSQRTMSEYMDELDPIAKERYLEKPRLVGLGEDDDPYKLWNCGKMVDKMCLWPPVEHGHIYNYFIIRPGVR